VPEQLHGDLPEEYNLPHERSTAKLIDQSAAVQVSRLKRDIERVELERDRAREEARRSAPRPDRCSA